MTISPAPLLRPLLVALALGLPVLLPLHATAQPATSSAPALTSTVELERARARAVRGPVDANGRAAVNAYLAGLTQGLGIDTAEGAEQAAQTVDAMRALYCQGVDAQADAFCPKLPALGCQLARRSADLRLEAADRGDDSGTYLSAAGAYQAVYDRARTRSASSPTDCGPLDEVLFNAAVAYRRAGRIPQAMGMLRLLAQLFPRSRSATAGLGLLGQAYLSMAAFDLAADSFEELATRAPTDVAAFDGLQNAIVLRLALGDATRALRDFDQFQKLYGAKHLVLTATLALRVAESVTEAQERGNGRLSEAEITTLVDRAVDLATRANDPELVARAHAVAARRLVGKNDAGARGHAETIAKLARSGVLRQLAQNTPRGAGLAPLGRALTAVGEAHFLLARMAERARKPLPTPTLPRRASRATIADFLQTKVAPWIERRRQTLGETEANYRPILDIAPVPPPRWVVAASGEISLAWIGLHAEIASIASAIADAGDREHARALRQSSETVTLRAKAAALAYLGLRAKLQTTSEHAAPLEVWLARTFPREPPPLEELVPGAHWTSAELPAALLLERSSP